VVTQKSRPSKGTAEQRLLGAELQTTRSRKESCDGKEDHQGRLCFSRKRRQGKRGSANSSRIVKEDERRLRGNDRKPQRRRQWVRKERRISLTNTE